MKGVEETMDHVLIVSLGPVQDFIATARKCRDLWFGSWVLSELAKAAARKAANACGIERLVFPAADDVASLDPDSDLLVANKVVVRVPDGKRPAELASEMEEAVRTRLREIRDVAFAAIKDRHGYFLRPTAEAQVDDLIEISWAYAGEDPDYKAGRDTAEKLLAARKNTRLWGAVTWGRDVPKSHLDGARESVLHEDTFNLPAEEIRQCYGVDEAERMCGVGLLKRHGRRPGRWAANRFVSTGHVAAWPLLERIRGAGADSRAGRAWSAYLDALYELGAKREELRLTTTSEGGRPGRDDIDGSVLFEGRVVKLVPAEKQRSAAEALQGFFADSGLPRPIPYYAVLAADGDRIGATIGALDTFDEHREFSKRLAEFALRVREIVEHEHGGELIYSGGDDVLAFVPLDRVLECSGALAGAFAETMKQTNSAGRRESPTLSVGIGISHFVEPMSEALETARNAEKLAKTIRNALAVIVDKRSGGRREVVGHWEVIDRALRELTVLHVREQVPDGAAYELEALTRMGEGLSKPDQRDRMEELIRLETWRVLGRKRPRGGTEGISPEARDVLQRTLESGGTAGLAALLIVAREFARVVEVAGTATVEVS